MSLSADFLLEHVIRETLDYLEEPHPAIANLLLGTAAQESRLGASMGTGRRFGLYCISPHSHRAIWDKYLINHPELASRVRGLAGQHSFLRNPHNELLGNLKYATAIAWMIYRRHAQPLPDADNIGQLADYWQRLYPHSDKNCAARDFVVSFYQQIYCLPVPAVAA